MKVKVRQELSGHRRSSLEMAAVGLYRGWEFSVGFEGRFEAANQVKVRFGSKLLAYGFLPIRRG